jgi:polysaccharide export outer membrane protein
MIRRIATWSTGARALRNTWLEPRMARCAGVALLCLLSLWGTMLVGQTGTAPGVTSGVTTMPASGQIPGQFPAQNPYNAPSTSGGANAGGMTTPTTAMLYPGEDFLLGRGDLISLRLFGAADYVTTVRLDTNGNVELPYIGSIHLEGLSIHQAQLLVADRLRTGGYYVNPEVIIQVIESLNSSVTIAGEVRAVVPVTGARRLIDVISAAGGLPPTASHTVRIIRPGEKEPIVLNLGTDLTNTAAVDTLVYPRDIIQVSRSGVVYVLGAFRTQGSLPLDQAMPLTLMQLAAMSGGVGYEGRYKDLRLIRTFGNERRLVKVDIKKVLNGKAPDPILQANDIVYLPSDPLKAAAKSLGVGGVIGVATILLTLQYYF